MDKVIAEHARILQSRYKQLLGSISNLESVASQLLSQGLLTLIEREEIKKRLSRADKEAFLCSCLTAKGVSKLVDISQVLKSEQVRQNSRSEAGRLPSGGGTGGGRLAGIEKWASSHEEVMGLGGDAARHDGRHLREGKILL